MTVMRIAGAALVAIGLVAVIWGGVFWTNRETVLDAGPLEVTAEKREGVPIPPVAGALAVIAGIVLLVIPVRRRI